MRKILTFLLILFINCSYGQYWALEYGTAGTYPLGALKNNGYKSGLGHSLTILSAPFPKYYNWQLQMGGNINYFWANNNQGNISHLFANDIFYSSASYKAKNRHMAISFKTRLSSRPNPVRFFVDLDLGYRFFKTKEIITPRYGYNQNKEINALINSGNFFAGITGGILFRMNRYWYLTLYSRFDYGLNTTWLNLNSVNFESVNNYTLPNYDSYDYPRTHTPILWTGFSMTFYFGGDGSAKKEKRTYSSGGSSKSRPAPSATPPIRGNEKPSINIPDININIPSLPKPKPAPKPKAPPVKPRPPVSVPK